MPCLALLWSSYLLQEELREEMARTKGQFPKVLTKTDPVFTVGVFSQSSVFNPFRGLLLRFISDGFLLVGS